MLYPFITAIILLASYMFYTSSDQFLFILFLVRKINISAQYRSNVALITIITYFHLWISTTKVAIASFFICPTCLTNCSGRWNSKILGKNGCCNIQRIIFVLFGGDFLYISRPNRLFLCHMMQLAQLRHLFIWTGGPGALCKKRKMLSSCPISPGRWGK